MNSPYKFTDPLGLAASDPQRPYSCGGDPQSCYEQPVMAAGNDDTNPESEKNKKEREFVVEVKAQPEPIQEEPTTLIRWHWFLERPIYRVVETGKDRGQTWRKERIGTEVIDYPSQFDDILFEYAQEEASITAQDEIAYAEWYVRNRNQVEVSGGFPAGGSITSVTAPPLATTISAEKLKSYKDRLDATLVGNKNEKALRSQVNAIIDKTYKESARTGRRSVANHPMVYRYRNLGTTRP